MRKKLLSLAVLTSVLLATVVATSQPAATGAATPASAASSSHAAIPSPPAVDARGYILVDNATGTVLAEHESDTRLEPASLTKLMTCYVVFTALKEGRLKLDEQVVISEHAWRAEGSRSFVQVGSRIPVETLIKGMIVQSGNDATIALAERVGGTEPGFAQMMNEYAKRLGLSNTHFDDSSGLPSPTHFTTAHDLSILARALIRDFPEYYPWFSIKQFEWNGIKQDNRNGLLERVPGVDGMKTGHTDAAGYCLVTSAQRQGMRLIAVVLGSTSIKGREDASAALINHGFTFYDTVSVKKRGAIILRPRVFKAVDDYYDVGTATDVDVVVPRGSAGSVVTSADVRQPLIAPISSVTPVGELRISVDGKVARTVPLMPLKDIPAGGWWSRFYDSIVLLFRRSG